MWNKVGLLHSYDRAVTLITEPFSQCAQNRSYLRLLEEQFPLEDQHPRRLNQQLGEELIYGIYLW